MNKRIFQALIVIASLLGFSEASYSNAFTLSALDFAQSEDMFDTDFDEAPDVEEI